MRNKPKIRNEKLPLSIIWQRDGDYNGFRSWKSAILKLTVHYFVKLETKKEIFKLK